MTTIPASVQWRAAFDTILVETRRTGSRPRRIAMMTTFHVDAPGAKRADLRREKYSTIAMAANSVAVLACGALAILAVAFAEPSWRRAAAACAASVVAPVAGAFVTSGGLPRRLAGPVAALIFISLLSFFAGAPPGVSLAAGAHAGALALLAAGICNILARALPGARAFAAAFVALLALAVSVLPFALTRDEQAAGAIEFASRVFVASPLAGSCAAARVDILRNDHLYSISMLGSSAPLGYPSALLHGAIYAAAGFALLVPGSVFRRSSQSLL